MASTHQVPFLPPPVQNPTLPSRRAIALVLSLASLACLATMVAVLRPSPAGHPIVTPLPPSDLCIRSPDPRTCRYIVGAAITGAAVQYSHLPGPGAIQVLQTLIDQSLVQLDAAAAAAANARGSAISDCVHLLNLSRERLIDSAAALTAGAHDDARTWLSAVLTNHVTCTDGLDGQSSPRFKAPLMSSLSNLASASLAVLNAASPDHGTVDLAQHVERFPLWVAAKDRRLLEEAPRGSGDGIEANVTVASDGSGDFVTVQGAVDSAPDKGKNRYVIHVRKGTYAENVIVGKKKSNVMIVGDGMDSTVITGSLNVVDGSTTFNSATLAAVGDGFILQDISIENTAGAAKHQAVALRVNADRAVINRCRINAYQDTLYAHSLRQFYRDSSISGTVDFVFGNAAVVFQNCSLIARLPMAQQKNIVTAQGRIDPNQNTGTSIQNCRVIPSPDLVPVIGSMPSYLGRPWRNFSRTVYMRSYIDSHISPKGWLEWDGDFALDTLYYGEFENFGPGAGVAGRVNWTGYHVITDPNEAMKFTVAELIQGDVWLQSTGVQFTDGL